MKVIHLILLSLLMSCSLIPNKRAATSVNNDRSIASFGKVKKVKKLKKIDSTVQIILKVNDINVCNREFSQIEASTGNPNYSIDYKQHSVSTLPYKFSLPQNLYSTSPKQLSRLKSLNVRFHRNSKNITINKPIFPDFPISNGKFNPKDCSKLQSYADRYQSMRSRKSLLKSDLYSFSFQGSKLKISKRNNASWKQSLKLKSQLRVFNTQKQLINTHQTSVSEIKYMIIYQDEYEQEANQLKAFRESKGIPTHIKALTDLPGYNAKDPTPAGCSGAHLKECYHYWNDPINNISQKMVPTLKGFHQETKAYQTYQRISYIPGLIRAYIRTIGKDNMLEGVLLIGNDRKMPGMNVDKNHYYYGGTHTYFPNHVGKIHSDLFYMLPWNPMQPIATPNHWIISPGMGGCQKDGVVEIDFWCDPDQHRHWADPALSASMSPPFTPIGRVFEKPNVNYEFQDYNMNMIIPVGRIPTQDLQVGGKDPVVADYVAKVVRWHSELPSMKGNSILSTGGSTSDHWIYLENDYVQFYNTYGDNSHGYASEFFVPVDKCVNCSYKSGADILTELASKNHVSFVINGHGGHAGVQAPFQNGNIGDGYSNENFWSPGGDQNRLIHKIHPDRNTPKVIENGSAMIGHVMANSCDISNFNLNSEMDNFVLALHPDANQRSFAEQLLTLPNAGALNTYMNSDVGWGGQDNRYNIKFMTHIKSAWENCGTIGDALRSTIYDMTHGNRGGATDFQAMNRQFLGSPLNAIARSPLSCRVIRPNISKDRR